jgi:hypothetical protein
MKIFSCEVLGGFCNFLGGVFFFIARNFSKKDTFINCFTNILLTRESKFMNAVRTQILILILKVQTLQ